MILLKSGSFGALENNWKCKNIIFNIRRENKHESLKIGAIQSSKRSFLACFFDEYWKSDLSISGQLTPESYWVDSLLFDRAQNVEFHRLDSHIWRLGTLQKTQISQIQTGLLVFFWIRTLWWYRPAVALITEYAYLRRKSHTQRFSSTKWSGISQLASGPPQINLTRKFD